MLSQYFLLSVDSNNNNNNNPKEQEEEEEEEKEEEEEEEESSTEMVLCIHVSMLAISTWQFANNHFHLRALFDCSSNTYGEEVLFMFTFELLRVQTS